MLVLYTFRDELCIITHVRHVAHEYQRPRGAVLQQITAPEGRDYRTNNRIESVCQHTSTNAKSADTFLKLFKA